MLLALGVVLIFSFCVFYMVVVYLAVVVFACRRLLFWLALQAAVALACRRLTCVACPAGGYRFGMPCRRPYFSKRPKSKQKVFLLLCCPFFNWKGMAEPFFEILFRGVAPIIVNYGHIHVHRAQSAVPGALTPRSRISKNNKKRGNRFHFVSVGTLRMFFCIWVYCRGVVCDAQVGWQKLIDCALVFSFLSDVFSDFYSLLLLAYVHTCMHIFVRVYSSFFSLLGSPPA